jgi:hypothetical protein
MKASLILTDNMTPPDGMRSVPYWDLYIHYDPMEYSEEKVDDMVIRALSGDDSELIGNARKDTQAHNMTKAAIEGIRWNKKDAS